MHVHIYKKKTFRMSKQTYLLAVRTPTVGAYPLNLAERRASATASSAIWVVRKQGKAEGSPWPRGMTGLGSDSLMFPMTSLSTPLIVIADAVLSTSFPLNPHLSAVPFSISLSPLLSDSVQVVNPEREREVSVCDL